VSPQRVAIAALVVFVVVITAALWRELGEDPETAVDAGRLAKALAEYRRGQQPPVLRAATEYEPWASVKPAESTVAWGRITWRDSSGRRICLGATTSQGPVVADYCGTESPFQWRFHEGSRCLENGLHKDRCLNKVQGRAQLSLRNDAALSGRRVSHPGARTDDRYYWWVDSSGGACLTVDDTDDPPWFLIYDPCHDDMHAQKFMFDADMGF